MIMPTCQAKASQLGACRHFFLPFVNVETQNAKVRRMQQAGNSEEASKETHLRYDEPIFGHALVPVFVRKIPVDAVLKERRSGGGGDEANA